MKLTRLAMVLSCGSWIEQKPNLEQGFFEAGLGDPWSTGSAYLGVSIPSSTLMLGSVLQDRIDAVEEILQSTSERLVKLREILRGLPDLAKGLCRIQYGQVSFTCPSTTRVQDTQRQQWTQCTPKEISILLPAFNKIAIAFDDVDPSDPSSVGLNSSVLSLIITSLPRLKGPVKELLQIVNIKKAGEDKKDMMWNDPERYPAIIDSDMVRRYSLFMNSQSTRLYSLCRPSKWNWRMN